MVVKKGCEICENTLQYLRELKLANKIKIIGKDSQLGLELKERFGFNAYPTFIFQDGFTFTGGVRELNEATKEKLSKLLDNRIPGRLKKDHGIPVIPPPDED